MNDPKYNVPRLLEKPPEHGDIRRVTVEVEAIFRNADVVIDWDSETGKPLETKKGLVMDIITKCVVYRDQPTIFLAHGLL